MAPPTIFLTTALLLSATVVNGLAIHQPIDAHHQPYATTEGNHESYDDHRQPLITSSRLSTQDSARVCITVGDNPDGTKYEICAENPDDLCYDPIWKVMPRLANALPWCASEGTSTELKAKRVVSRQGNGGTGGAAFIRKRKVERRGGVTPAPPAPGPVLTREAVINQRSAKEPGHFERGVNAPGGGAPGSAIP